MPKQNKTTTLQLMRKFAPYFTKYKKILILDLICAALTTLCELALPLIMRYLTNTAMANTAALTVGAVGKLGFLYFILRIIDGIANFFLKNPPVLILDEATSALDNESEYLVSQSLEQLAKGRTTITIAHRLTTIQGADRILVLSEDGIEEEGTHEELLLKKGAYYNLYQTANTLA